MTGKKRERLRRECGWDREAFAWKVYLAVKRGDWKFVAEVAEAMKPQEPKKHFPLHLQIQAAYQDLCSQTPVGIQVTNQMFHNFVDPERKISPQQFRAACRKVDIKLPSRTGPRKAKQRIVTKLSSN